uniref:SEA domain-containing protein n=1 Tax=Heterorhabditis bacteriophora TaxID=37862 RepID=A0A1I7WE14_HETBA
MRSAGGPLPIRSLSVSLIILIITTLINNILCAPINDDDGSGYLDHLDLSEPEMDVEDLLRPPDTYKEEFLKTSKRISDEVDRLLSDLPGQHRSSIFQYRYHQVIGTLAYLDIYSDAERPEVRDSLLLALHNSSIGPFPVSNEGFELHIIKVLNYEYHWSAIFVRKFFYNCLYNIKCLYIPIFKKNL